jgi:hypothetical protein
MFATLGGKIGAFAPARPCAHGAEKNIAYDVQVSAAFRERTRRDCDRSLSWRPGWRL